MEATTVPQDNSELLSEGIRSYRRVLFAVGEFRAELRQRIRNVLNQRLEELAAAMNLAAKGIEAGLKTYAEPDRVSESFDGSLAGVGWSCQRADQPWSFYAVWYSDEETEFGSAYVSLWLRAAPCALAVQKLQSISQPDWGAEGGEIYLSIPLAGDSANAVDLAFNVAIDKATALWRNVGGVRQFLSTDMPPAA